MSLLFVHQGQEQIFLGKNGVKQSVCNSEHDKIIHQTEPFALIVWVYFTRLLFLFLCNFYLIFDGNR